MLGLGRRDLNNPTEFRGRRDAHLSRRALGALNAYVWHYAKKNGWTQNEKMNRTNFDPILDRQQKIVDDLASKFRNIVVLAASGGVKEDVTGQEAASTTLNINVETQGLVSSILSFLD